MAEVKWIKLVVTIFEHRKIKHLRRLPDGNNIVLIWVMLLTMAGRCNAGGRIFLTENIPYTPKMLADELDFEENTVILALQALENLDMIMTDGKFFSIAGWEEYQNIEGMDRIREQTRERVAKCRERKRLSKGSVTSNVTVTQGNAVEGDKEKEIEIDTESAEKRAGARARGKHQNVILTDEQYAELSGKIPDVDAYIDMFSAKLTERGYRYDDHFTAIITWWERDKGTWGKSPKAKKKPAASGSFDITEFFAKATKKKGDQHD